MNNFAMMGQMPQGLAGFSMGASRGMAPQSPHVNGPKVGAIGLKGPWHLNPGNPKFPNHRPYLTNDKAPNMMAAPPSQQQKFT